MNIFIPAIADTGAVTAAIGADSNNVISQRLLRFYIAITVFNLLIIFLCHHIDHFARRCRPGIKAAAQQQPQH